MLNGVVMLQLFPAFQERVDFGANGVWLRVVIGPYLDRATAEKVATELKKEEFAAIVRQR